MVGDHQEVERPLQPRWKSGRRLDFLALGEAVGGVEIDCTPDHPGIGGVGGVQVGVAEEDLVGEFLTGVGRISTPRKY
jgi:hypothetical protein